MELEQVWSLRRSEKPENGDRNSEAPQHGGLVKSLKTLMVSFS